MEYIAIALGALGNVSVTVGAWQGLHLEPPTLLTASGDIAFGTDPLVDAIRKTSRVLMWGSVAMWIALGAQFVLALNR